MPLVLPQLPATAPDERGPYCVIATHRAIAGRADAYERRMLADIERTRAEPGALQFHIHFRPLRSRRVRHLRGVAGSARPA